MTNIRMAPFVLSMALCLCPSLARGERVLVVDSSSSVEPGGYRVINCGDPPNWPGLRFSQELSRLHVGNFPSLVDLETGDRVVVGPEGVTNAAFMLDSLSASRVIAENYAAQLAKPPRLVQAERKLIEFLRTEGAIAAGAVLATADEIDAMVANWEATLNDAQLDKKYAKYDRLLRAVERRGGTESGARYH